MNWLRLFAALSTLGLMSTPALSEDLPLYPYVVPTSSLACANYGDFVSCSAQYLNFLETGDPAGDATTDYVDPSPQGALFDPIVIFVGSEASADNSEYGTTLDDAYQPSGGASPLEYGTHFNTGADPDPTFTGDNNTGAIPGDTSPPPEDEQFVDGNTATAWDISLATLIDALTLDDGRHDMYVFFDNNQIGEDEGQNLLSWALVCAQGDGLEDVCYELNGVAPPPPFPGPDPTTFTTTKSFGDVPDPGDYVLVNGTVCVDNTTGLPVAFNTNSCPAGSTLIDNNLGTNDTEFIVQIPELNDSLETLLAAGYTNLAIQFRFTNNNDGFEDIYIMAGALRQQLPEPGSLGLLALALLALATVGQRARRG